MSRGKAMVVIYLSVIILMRVVQSLFNKRACICLPEGLNPYVKYIGLSKLFAALFALLFVVSGEGFSGINLQMLLIAFSSGTFLALGSVCGIKALNSGTIVLNSMFATAGLIVPCILGVFFFEEPVSILQILCILLLFVSTILLIDSSKKISAGFSKKTIFYSVGSLITNGMVMFCQKLFGELQPNGNVSMFSMVTFLLPALVMLIAIPFIPKQKEVSSKLPASLIVYAMILAFAVFVIQQIVTMLTPLLSSAVLFTFVNGGATVIAAIVGAVVYKEKLTLKSVIGIVLGISAMVCIKIF